MCFQGEAQPTCEFLRRVGRVSRKLAPGSHLGAACVGSSTRLKQAESCKGLHLISGNPGEAEKVCALRSGSSRDGSEPLQNDHRVAIRRTLPLASFFMVAMVLRSRAWACCFLSQPGNQHTSLCRCRELARCDAPLLNPVACPVSHILPISREVCRAMLRVELQRL